MSAEIIPRLRLIALAPASTVSRIARASSRRCRRSYPISRFGAFGKYWVKDKPARRTDCGAGRSICAGDPSHFRAVNACVAVCNLALCQLIGFATLVIDVSENACGVISAGPSIIPSVISGTAATRLPSVGSD